MHKTNGAHGGPGAAGAAPAVAGVLGETASTPDAAASAAVNGVVDRVLKSGDYAEFSGLWQRMLLMHAYARGAPPEAVPSLEAAPLSPTQGEWGPARNRMPLPSWWSRRVELKSCFVSYTGSDKRVSVTLRSGFDAGAALAEVSRVIVPAKRVAGGRWRTRGADFPEGSRLHLEALELAIGVLVPDVFLRPCVLQPGLASRICGCLDKYNREWGARPGFAFAYLQLPWQMYSRMGRAAGIAFAYLRCLDKCIRECGARPGFPYAYWRMP